MMIKLLLLLLIGLALFYIQDVFNLYVRTYIRISLLFATAEVCEVGHRENHRIIKKGVIKKSNYSHLSKGGASQIVLIFRQNESSTITFSSYVFKACMYYCV